MQKVYPIIPSDCNSQGSYFKIIAAMQLILAKEKDGVLSLNHYRDFLMTVHFHSFKKEKLLYLQQFQTINAVKQVVIPFLRENVAMNLELPSSPPNNSRHASLYLLSQRFRPDGSSEGQQKTASVRLADELTVRRLGPQWQRDSKLVQRYSALQARVKRLRTKMPQLKADVLSLNIHKSRYRALQLQHILLSFGLEFHQEQSEAVYDLRERLILVESLGVQLSLMRFLQAKDPWQVTGSRLEVLERSSNALRSVFATDVEKETLKTLQKYLQGYLQSEDFQLCLIDSELNVAAYNKQLWYSFLLARLQGVALTEAAALFLEIHPQLEGILALVSDRISKIDPDIFQVTQIKRPMTVDVVRTMLRLELLGDALGEMLERHRRYKYLLVTIQQLRLRLEICDDRLHDFDEFVSAVHNFPSRELVPKMLQFAAVAQRRALLNTKARRSLGQKPELYSVIRQIADLASEGVQQLRESCTAMLSTLTSRAQELRELRDAFVERCVLLTERQAALQVLQMEQMTRCARFTTLKQLTKFVTE